MTKTDRILGHLPSTFRPRPEGSALYAVVDAFGGELLAAENSLAAVMRAHWVDLADKGETSFTDLTRIAGVYGLVPDLVAFAALYGLAPRDDESVEEFREHLKRYVRTFLEGTVTVQGILRITAEALGLRIADDLDDLDAWWDRPGELLTTTTARSVDAAELVFGFPSADVRGAASTPAAVTGTADLGEPVDLQGTPELSVAVDGGGPVTVDLAAAAADPAAVTGTEIRDALVAAVPGLRARLAADRLTLASGTTGVGSRLELDGGAGDAAPAVLGLAPRSYQGRDPAGARVEGEVDLSGPLDLTEARYLRLRVDAAHHAEVDCAAGAADPAAVTLGQVVAAIDDQLGVAVASADGGRLVLASPTTGSGSVIHIQEAAAQDARVRLLGDVDRFHLGRDAVPARVEGARDLGAGVDLAAGSTLRVAIDGGAPVNVDVAGADPAATTPAEIVIALNTALGAPVADHDGRFVTIASPTAGPAGSVEIGDVDGDAAPAVLGLAPRRYTGTAPTTARIGGTADLSAGADLRARHVVGVAVGAGEPVEVDARSAAADPAQVGPGDVVAAINNALGSVIASSDGQRVALTAPVAGGGGRVRIVPLLRRRNRRYVTRATVTDDAAGTVLGVPAASARGSDGSQAAIRGTADLTGGADLRAARYLRLAVDGAPFQDVDCAGARPRATTAAEAVAAINDALGMAVASTDGRTIHLVSPTTGAASRLELEPARATDALPGLLGVAPGTYRGTPATRVVLTGVPDLSGGVDLAANAAVKIGVDGGPLTEVTVGDVGPATRTLSQIGVAINVAFAAQVAGSDGTRLSLASPTTGAGSRLEFAAPGNPDATAAILGFAPPREYRGAPAGPARVVGTGLTPPLDLSVARTLRIGVDGAPAAPVDVAAAAADPAAATLPEVVDAINDALGGPIAAEVAGRLELTSPTTGLSSRITLEAATAGDARRTLLGEAPDAAVGEGATPATIIGEADLSAPVDLSAHTLLRIVVDGGLPRDIDVSGASAAQTFAEEIVAAIDDIMPGIASLEGNRLRLTSPTAGAAGTIAVEPRRHLEVQEYPPEPAAARQQVRHGSLVATSNGGAAEATFELDVMAEHGVVGPRLVSLTHGWSLRVHGHFRPGTTVTVALGDEGEPSARARPAGGAAVPLDPATIEVREHDPGARGLTLRLPRGRSRFMYLECTADRFAAAGDPEGARFGTARFAGPPCREVGVFDGSVFADGGVDTIFAPSPPSSSPPVELALRWEEHRPGSFVVNLPVELDPRYGGRFNQARFGGRSPEEYPGSVFEPPADPDHLATRLNADSGLVVADIVTAAPIGYEEVAVPFRSPQRLTLGNADRPARLYLTEEGLDGVLRVSAGSPGEWGNGIAVTARMSGPARYDVEVLFPGSRFENARQVVAGPELPVLAAHLLVPGPVGVLAAKGGGVRARVERDRA